MRKKTTQSKGTVYYVLHIIDLGQKVAEAEKLVIKGSRHPSANGPFDLFWRAKQHFFQLIVAFFCAANAH